MKSLDQLDQVNKKIVNLATPTASTDGATKGYVDNTLAHPYFARLAALMEPDAIDYPRNGTFTYAVGSNETKYMLLAWKTYIDPNTSARYDVRNPKDSLPLRNITIKGIASDSTAIFLDPSKPTFVDARDTYYDRLEAIATLPTKHVWDAGTASNNETLFLPGPYGSILTSVMAFDFGWVALGATGTNSASGYPLDYETNDDATFPIRFQHTMTLPITKAFVRSIYTGYPKGGTAGRGVITFVDVPSTWSAVTDPNAPYDFRDDFMGASLNTSSVWTRTQSTAGNIEIDPMFAWLKLTGNGTYGNNGIYAQNGVARSAQPYMVFEFHLLQPTFIIGFSTGGGFSNSDFAHALQVSTPGVGTNISPVENGTARSSTAITTGHTYRARIRALSGGGATYEIQGGPTFQPIGAPTWTDLTPGTSSSPNNTLFAGASVQSNALTGYLSDPRIYTP